MLRWRRCRASDGVDLGVFPEWFPKNVMLLVVPKEIVAGERRVALVPESVKKLVKAGIAVAVEAGAGAQSLFADEAYVEAGAKIEQDAALLFQQADIILKIQPPIRRPDLQKHEASMMKAGVILVTTLRPQANLDAVRELVQAKVTAFSTDCIPRITRAQSMDTLSSQATVAGYRAVILAADELGKFFPMLMTAAGTVLSAKVLVIGAGVAGLQAIATARRLGATVEAFDTRPVVKEQVESLGARFVSLDVPHEAAQDAGGYAKQMSDDFYRREMELIGKHTAAADVVITTALIGGVKAPKLILEEMVRAMKPGSVIVDLAAEAGGNCSLTEPGRTVIKHGVRICGPPNPASDMPYHASILYSRNVTAFTLAFWMDNSFRLDLDDEILKGAVVTHDGLVRHGPTQQALAAATATV